MMTADDNGMQILTLVCIPVYHHVPFLDVSR